MADLILATPVHFRLLHNVTHSASSNGTHKDHPLTSNGQFEAHAMTSSTTDEVIAIPQQSAAIPLVVTPPPTDSAQKRTVFPTHNLRPSARLWFYLLPKRFWFGTSLLRWVLIFSLLAAAIYFFAQYPLRWVAVTVVAVALAALLYTIKRWQPLDFVRFSEQPLEPNSLFDPSPLDAGEKIPIHATGRFEVEGKDARFTWLPGFYRTFATREHAIMCLVKSGQFEPVAFWARIGYWNPDMEGMWYMFLAADAIEQIRQGDLDFGSDPQPTVAIDYVLTMPPRNLVQKLLAREQRITETLYLTCESSDDRDRILADLQYDHQ